MRPAKRRRGQPRSPGRRDGRARVQASGRLKRGGAAGGEIQALSGRDSGRLQGAVLYARWREAAEALDARQGAPRAAADTAVEADTRRRRRPGRPPRPPLKAAEALPPLREEEVGRRRRAAASGHREAGPHRAVRPARAQGRGGASEGRARPASPPTTPVNSRWPKTLRRNPLPPRSRAEGGGSEAIAAAPERASRTRNRREDAAEAARDQRRRARWERIAAEAARRRRPPSGRRAQSAGSQGEARAARRPRPRLDDHQTRLDRTGQSHRQEAES